MDMERFLIESDQLYSSYPFWIRVQGLHATRIESFLIIWYGTAYVKYSLTQGEQLGINTSLSTFTFLSYDTEPPLYNTNWVQLAIYTSRLLFSLSQSFQISLYTMTHIYKYWKCF